MSDTTTNGTQTSQMVLRLMEEAELSATDISEAMGRRVSRRTIYRWAKGESEPQQGSDIDALKAVYKDWLVDHMKKEETG